MVLRYSGRAGQNCLNKPEIIQAEFDECHGDSVIGQSLYPGLEGIGSALMRGGQEGNSQKSAHLRRLIANGFHKKPANTQIACFDPAASTLGIDQLNIQLNTAASMSAFFCQTMIPQRIRMRRNLRLPTWKT
jgi:hypothetical protein